MAYKGKFTPKHPEKYAGDLTKKIIWRSLWEREFMILLDTSSSILHWNSEDTIVRYLSPVDKKMHRYFIDFWVEIKEKDGRIVQKLIEIKPYAQSIQPRKNKKRNSRRYINDVKRYGINQAKWYYARHFAEQHDMEFIVMTERGIWTEENVFEPSRHKLFG